MVGGITTAGNIISKGKKISLLVAALPPVKLLLLLVEKPTPQVEIEMSLPLMETPLPLTFA